ncbi:monocyte to macrophage differentiation factor isoform X1 [Centruroides vittatus]|uniref:monocyte to macrophage differentiation factor isoform X1 n=1 Tax=Centruroides vittatus TaxID=120091 RepID=UPI00351025D6
MEGAVSDPSSKNRYMNRRAVGNQAYVPTEVEHLANVVTHGLSVLPSLLGLVFLLQQSSGKSQYLTCLIYGLSMVALFSISTFFHSVFYLGRFRLLKEVLHRCDRAIIYVFIAASYTPWLTLKEMGPDSPARHLRWLVWLLALLGIAYQHFFHERYKTLETCFYAVIGIVPGLAVFSMCERSGMLELTAGGLLYIVGVVFFKSDGRIPCAHAIWHLFVNVGALCHYYAICKYLLRPDRTHGIDVSRPRTPPPARF